MMNKVPQSSIISSRSRGAFEIALLYLLIGILWIVFSDEAAAVLAPNQAALTQISIYKGWGYVLVTALLLYWMIRRHTQKISQAKLTLNESEKNYQELLQQASDGIFIADAQGQYTLVNEEGCRLVGYTQAELLSMNLRELIAPEDLQNQPARLAELQSGKTLLSERKLLRKDGSRIVCEISAKLLKDGRYQSIVRDITERKVTNEALLRSEQRYRSLFENMTNGFSRCQMIYENGAPTDFVYLDINEAFKKLTGLQDVIGKRVSAVIPGIRESNPELFEIYGRVAITGNPEKFETHVPGLRSGVWFSVSVYSTEKNFFVAVFEAITERKQAEAALRENEERLRLSLHAANQGLYDLNVQTGNAIVNREYAEMLGYDFDSFVETNAAWIERLHPDDQEITANAYADYIKGLTSEYRVEFRQRTKAGDWKWILSLGKVVEYDAAGKPLRMLGTHTDITERKAAEAKLRDSEWQYRLMFTNNPLPMFVFDRATFAFLAVNDATVAHYGYSYAEFMKMTIKDIRPPDDIPAMISAVAIKSEPYFNVGVFRHRKKDGTLIDVEITRHEILFDGREALMVLAHDVTEQKRAEAALRNAHDELELQVQLRTQALAQANTLLETMLEYTPDQIYFKDANSRFIRNSRSQAQALGLSDASQVVGKTDFDFFPHAQRSYEEEQEIIRSGKPLVDFEEWVVWPNGQEMWVSTTKVPLRDQVGQIIGTFGISRDITERKHNEAALRKAKEELEFKVAERTTELREINEQLQRELSERKQAEAQIEYQAHLLENVSEAIIATDEKQMITAWNSGAENLYGWNAAEVIGKPARQVIHSEFSEVQRAEAVKALTETGDFKVEVIQYHRNGQMFWAEGHTISVRDETGKVTGFVAINRDITDRKQAADKLRQSEENFVKAFSSNPAAIAITRLADGKFININPAYTRIMEYEPNEILGHTAAEMNIYVRAEERAQIVQQLREQGTIQNYELLVRTKSGETRSIVISMEPLLYNAEECILTVFIDISERQKMEAELRRSNDELEQFAYVASHDLQEPLRAVAGMVQLLGQRYQGKLDERADEYIGHAVEASTRMQKLINDLLDYSRVNRLGRSFESTAVERSLNNALANLQLAIQESQAQITHDPLPTLMADTLQLTQLLQNLIGNAIKFRGARPLHIHLGAKKIEQAWQFSVSDNGIGIDPKYFERIFLVFQRLHTRREYPGTGIGLALCKKIIERHSGEIWVESQPGLGSTFYFTIPERQP